MYDNAMDIIQLVFGFVNAPFFATFLLGMFWKRTTGTGAFLGLFGGIAASAFSMLSPIAQGNRSWHQRRLCACHANLPQRDGAELLARHIRLHRCFVLTLVISLATSAHQVRRRIERPGLFAHAENRGQQHADLSKARRASASRC